MPFLGSALSGDGKLCNASKRVSNNLKSLLRHSFSLPCALPRQISIHTTLRMTDEAETWFRFGEPLKIVRYSGGLLEHLEVAESGRQQSSATTKW